MIISIKGPPAFSSLFFRFPWTQILITVQMNLYLGVSIRSQFLGVPTKVPRVTPQDRFNCT